MGMATPEKKEKKAAFHSSEGKLPPEHLSVLQALRDSGGKGGKVSFDDMVRPYYGDDYLKEQRKAKESLDSWNPERKINPFLLKYANGTEEEKSKILKDEQAIRREGLRESSLAGITLSGASQFQREQKRDVVFRNPDQGDAFGMRGGESMDTLGGSVYLPQKKTVHTIDPNGLKTGEGGGMIEGMFNESIPDWGSDFSKDPEKQFLSILEHELGHGVGGGMSSDQPINGNYANHIALPAELINGLGKVNRERFLMTGRRFETGPEFREFFNQEMEKSPEKRFEGFSEEARRTWRVLGDDENGEIPRNKMEKIMNVSEKLIPGLVQKEPSLEDQTMSMVRNILRGPDQSMG